MSLGNLGVPPLAVNGYLWDTLKQIDPTLANKYKTKTPIFPLGDSATGTKSWENKTYLIYDRMLKMRTGPFYPIKKENLIYMLKGKEIDTLEWGAAIQIILDREDDSAKDINDWIRENGGNTEYPVYFHRLRVYQTDSSSSSASSNRRDISSRPFYITEFLIDMEYHFTDSLEDLL